MTLLSARHISAAIDGRPLIQDVSLEVAAGEVLAIIGPNGAGKTSLARTLTGDLIPQQGDVLFGGQPLVHYSADVRARSLAMLSQQTVLNFPFAVTDVVQLGRIPHGTGLLIDKEIVAETLAAMDMYHCANRLYTHLSGGEKQRVQLARVIAQIWRREDAPARLLILDEPTASLDVAHTRQLMRVIRHLAHDGAAVIMIVHDFNIAARYADCIAVLKNGIVEAQGAPAKVITEHTMARIFGVESRVVPHPENGKPMVFIDD